MPGSPFATLHPGHSGLPKHRPYRGGFRRIPPPRPRCVGYDQVRRYPTGSHLHGPLQPGPVLGNAGSALP